jgi:hypothetical protein
MDTKYLEETHAHTRQRERGGGQNRRSLALPASMSLRRKEKKIQAKLFLADERNL